MKRPSSHSPFPQTRWSVVLQAAETNEAGRRALGELCADYWFPLYAFARRSGNSAADAEDLVQGFLLKATEDGLFAKADEDKGKLRTFLLTVFRRYARDEYAKTVSAKRGGGNVVSFDAAEAESWYEAESSRDDSPEKIFDRQWAVSLLDNAMNRLERSWRERGKETEFAALRPFLTTGGTTSDYQEIGERIGMKPDTVKVTLHRLRAKFGTVLREEIRETQIDNDDVDAELNYLIQLV